MIESKTIKVSKWSNQERSKLPSDRIKSDQSYKMIEVKANKFTKCSNQKRSNLRKDRIKSIKVPKWTNLKRSNLQNVWIKAIKVSRWSNSKHFKWVASNWDIITPLDCFCVHHLLTVQQAQPSQLTLYFNQVKRMFISTSCKQDKLMKICLPLLLYIQLCKVEFNIWAECESWALKTDTFLWYNFAFTKVESPV